MTLLSFAHSLEFCSSAFTVARVLQGNNKESPALIIKLRSRNYEIAMQDDEFKQGRRKSLGTYCVLLGARLKSN